jgi:hypothetical protein
MSLPDDFSSPEALRQSFTHGLDRMLAGHDGLGAYILVLANAAADSTLWPLLERRLEERHYHLAALLTSALRQGRRVSEPEDDVTVFLKLMAVGFERLGLTESRGAGPWEIQFNPLRAYRPPRTSRARVEELSLPFDPEGFHFNRPFLRREAFWTGMLGGRRTSLLYNKFPFVELHGLLVPEPEQERPQYLTPEVHGWAWELVATAGARMPGFGLAYNSCGAHASVNHLHFQSFLRDRPLPVTAGHWLHNGGDVPYPATCQVHDDPLSAWVAVDTLHSRGRPYNLIYLPERLYLLPRQRQGDYRHSPWAAGHAWYEMAGGVTTSSRDDFTSLETAAIEAELRLTSGVS